MVPITRTQTHQVIVGAHPGSHVQGQSSRKLSLGWELDGVGAGVLGSHVRELLPDTLPDLRILWKKRGCEHLIQKVAGKLNFYQ